MKYETLDVSKENDVATVMLNRPHVHNAMNEILCKELIHCFQQLANDASVRVIILTGSGSSFCAGADLNWMKGMIRYSQEGNRRESNLILEMYQTIFSSPKPVIGKINGNAFGGGVGLIAVCDITIAAPGAQFAFSEVKLGIIPSIVSTFVSYRLTRADMRRLFLTGERFDTMYAHEIGLVDFIVPSEELDKKVEYYVNQIRSSGPQAILEVKTLMQKFSEMKLDDYKSFTVDKIAELRVSEEGQEGISAFLEKRKPRWSD